MSKLDLDLKDLERQELENLSQIQKNVNNNPFSIGNWQRLTVETTAAVSGQTLSHGLKATPTDVVVSRSEGGTISFSYASFTKTSITFSTTAATKANIFVGYF